MLFASLCFLVAAGLAHATVASNRQRPVDWNIGQPSKIHSVDYSKCLAFTNTTDEIMQVTLEDCDKDDVDLLWQNSYGYWGNIIPANDTESCLTGGTMVTVQACNDQNVTLHDLQTWKKGEDKWCCLSGGCLDLAYGVTEHPWLLTYECHDTGAPDQKNQLWFSEYV